MGGVTGGVTGGETGGVTDGVLSWKRGRHVAVTASSQASRTRSSCGANATASMLDRSCTSVGNRTGRHDLTMAKISLTTPWCSSTSSFVKGGWPSGRGVAHTRTASTSNERTPPGADPSGGDVIARSSRLTRLAQVLDGGQDDAQSQIDQVDARHRDHGFARQHDTAVQQTVRKLE